jgi:hypothetical protein
VDIINKERIRRSNHLPTFGCTVPKETNFPFFQPGSISFCIYNISRRFANRLQINIIDSCIHLHPTGIEHGAIQTVGRIILLFQCGNSQHFQRRDTDQRYAVTETQTFGYRYADTQSGIRSRTAADSYCIQLQSFFFGYRNSLFRINTQQSGVRRTFK